MSKVHEYWVLCFDHDGNIIGDPIGDINGLTGVESPISDMKYAESISEDIICENLVAKVSIVETKKVFHRKPIDE